MVHESVEGRGGSIRRGPLRFGRVVVLSPGQEARRTHESRLVVRRGLARNVGGIEGGGGRLRGLDPAKQGANALAQLIEMRLGGVALSGARGDLELQIIAFLSDELAGIHLLLKAKALTVGLDEQLLGLVARGGDGAIVILEPGTAGLQRLDAILVVGAGLALALSTAPKAQRGYHDHDQRLM